jgi:hypothetical protein
MFYNAREIPTSAGQTINMSLNLIFSLSMLVNMLSTPLLDDTVAVVCGMIDAADADVGSGKELLSASDVVNNGCVEDSIVTFVALLTTWSRAATAEVVAGVNVDSPAVSSDEFPASPVIVKRAE